MNSVDFFDAIGSIEDEYIMEVEEYKKRIKKNKKGFL